MAVISSARSCMGYLSAYSESPLFECCYCRGSLSDPVLLKCLHSCCRLCAFDASSSTAGQQTTMSFSFVKCPVCCEETEHFAATPNGLLGNYRRLSALISESLCCGKCEVDDVHAAVFWCVDCCLGLCDDCYTWHNRFTLRHRSAELEDVRNWSASQVVSAAQCSTHEKEITKVQCFTCREPKCQPCSQSCRAGTHDMQPLFHDETTKYLSKVICDIIAKRERLDRLVSALHQKCRNTVQRLHEARAKDGRMLVCHKKHLHDSAVIAHDTSYVKVYVNLETMWYKCTTIMGRRAATSETAILAACSIEAISVGRWMPRVLYDRHLLKGISKCCILNLCVSLGHCSNYLLENRMLSIDGSLPLTLDIALRSCLGATGRRRIAAPRAPTLFDHVPCTFWPPVECEDLAMTRDGHVLLAAAERGLLVYCDRAEKLSWRPARRSDGRDDLVRCVAALSEGQAAVGVFYARLIILLRLSQTGDTWLENRLLAELQSPPWRLVALGDLLGLAAIGELLAVAELRPDEQHQRWVEGRQVKLLRKSNRQLQLLYTHCRDYEIDRVALTALCVVTTSCSNSGVACVVDAFSHSGQFLWRHKTNDKEFVPGLCVSAETGNRVYMIVCRRDRNSSRVVAIGGADGSGRTDVMSTRTHGLHTAGPLALARGQQRTVLAVLSLDRARQPPRIVSLYKATSERGAETQ